PSSALRAPSPASGRRAGVAQGAQAGCAFFAPGFLAQAKKGGSRRRAAKALDLDVAPAGRQQEQLAALAPSSALRAPSPASGRRVKAAPGAQAGCAFFAPGFLAWTSPTGLATGSVQAVGDRHDAHRLHRAAVHRGRAEGPVPEHVLARGGVEFTVAAAAF